MSDIWSYEGKRVAIVGCFSGMGEACARELVRLGAEVHGADLRESPVPLASFTQVDLKDWSSIDKAVASIGGEIDALFNCAGLPQTFPAIDVMRVNFLGIRHWTEQWLPRLRRPGAVATISSLAGMGWMQQIKDAREAIAIEDEGEFIAWCEAHPELVGDGYRWSKTLINTWTQILAAQHAREGLRFNCTMPSPVKTPMFKDFQVVAGDGVLNAFTAPSYRFSEPADQGNPLVWLNSDAAAFVSGVALPVDLGFWGGVITGELDMEALMAEAAKG
jgi:NAD(P)-dependent dehydrogenase (short-subunit alcohol dehydrogenase family)